MMTINTKTTIIDVPKYTAMVPKRLLNVDIVALINFKNAFFKSYYCTKL